MFKEYDIVKANHDLSSKVLRGTLGTIVLIYRECELDLAYEVEFVDDNNDTIEILTVYPENIILKS